MAQKTDMRQNSYMCESSIWMQGCESLFTEVWQDLSQSHSSTGRSKGKVEDLTRRALNDLNQQKFSSWKYSSSFDMALLSAADKPIPS